MTTDTGSARIFAKRLEATTTRQKDNGKYGEQDRKGDLVRRLLPAGPFDQVDHPVEEGLPWLGRYPDHDSVREHLRPPGDRRAVTA